MVGGSKTNESSKTGNVVIIAVDIAAMMRKITSVMVMVTMVMWHMMMVMMVAMLNIVIS